VYNSCVFKSRMIKKKSEKTRTRGHHPTQKARKAGRSQTADSIMQGNDWTAIPYLGGTGKGRNAIFGGEGNSII